MVKSRCLFCSLGCELNFTAAGKYQDGPLCARGHYNFEWLNHPGRLTEPQIGSRQVSWDEAISFLGRKLQEQGPDSIGILLSALASNEAAYLTAKYAKLLGTKNISVATDAADQEAYQGSQWEAPGAALASLEDIENSETLIIIGDILTRGPVLAKRINKVKYGKRGNKIIVIDPNETHTSWFATEHIRVAPGTEAQALAKLIENKVSGTVILAPSPTIQRNDLVAYLCKVLAASTGTKYIIYYGGGNTLGANKIIDHVVPGHLPYAELAHKIKAGQIKALLMLGEDFSAGIPEIKKCKFIAATAYFAGELAQDSVLLMPAASHLESQASFGLATGQLVEVTAAAPKVGGRANLDILAQLMNTTVEESHVRESGAEIINSEPVYQTVNLQDKIKEAAQISGQGQAAPMDITHFGNNNLVRNFHWYKVNNPSTELGING